MRPKSHWTRTGSASCQPGGDVIFSGAQMDENMPNVAICARRSIDFRTVHRDDAIDKRMPPNVDFRRMGTTKRDDLRASNLLCLPDELVRLCS